MGEILHKPFDVLPSSRLLRESVHTLTVKRAHIFFYGEVALHFTLDIKPQNGKVAFESRCHGQLSEGLSGKHCTILRITGTTTTDDLPDNVSSKFISGNSDYINLTFQSNI